VAEKSDRKWEKRESIFLKKQYFFWKGVKKESQLFISGS
jgi:hypothetical protein